ncbi:MAG TPA: hypothetical protein VFB78_12630 [Acidimicrobiales bacterium]|nr:hypothetical protein [Acidimicrobiales bacterium]
MLLDEQVVTLLVGGAMDDDTARRAVALFAVMLQDAAVAVGEQLAGALGRADIDVVVGD